MSNGVQCVMRRKKVSTHLFLHCPFARACWHGSMLSIHTTELNHISVQQWIEQLISSYNRNGVDSMCYLQDVLIILWTL